MTEPAPRVAWIAIAPVKSMALTFLDRAELTLDGIAGDREFALLDEADRLVNGKRAGPLQTIRAERRAGDELAFHFPDGSVVAAVPELGAPVDGIFFGHLRPTRIVEGPWSDAVSAFVGHPLRLVALGDGRGLDRGPSATLVSTAALTALAEAGGVPAPLDRRRFRMTFGIEGVPAYAEDGWIGRRVRVGDALVAIAGNVGRCAVTTQDPDTGQPSFDTLGTLQRTRGHLPTTEPLPFGVWAEVDEAGAVGVGDPVTVEP